MSMDPISYTASLLIDLKEATRSKKLVTMLKETQRWLDSHINVVVAGRSSAPEQNLVEWLVGTARPAMNNHGVVSFSPSKTHTTLAWNANQERWVQNSSEAFEGLETSTVERWWVRSPAMNAVPNICLTWSPGLTHSESTRRTTHDLARTANFCIVPVRASQVGGMDELSLVEELISVAVPHVIVLLDEGLGERDLLEVTWHLMSRLKVLDFDDRLIVWEASLRQGFAQQAIDLLLSRAGVPVNTKLSAASLDHKLLEIIDVLEEVSADSKRKRKNAFKKGIRCLRSLAVEDRYEAS